MHGQEPTTLKIKPAIGHIELNKTRTIKKSINENTEWNIRKLDKSNNTTTILLIKQNLENRIENTMIPIKSLHELEREIVLMGSRQNKLKLNSKTKGNGVLFVGKFWFGMGEREWENM